MVLNLVPGYHGTVVCTHRIAVRVCTHYSCISVSYESAHPGTVPWYGPYRTRVSQSSKIPGILVRYSCVLSTLRPVATTRVLPRYIGPTKFITSTKFSTI